MTYKKTNFHTRFLSALMLAAMLLTLAKTVFGQVRVSSLVDTKPLYRDSLSLEEAIDRVIGNHYQVKVAQEEMSAAQAQEGVNRSGYLPSVGFTGTYTGLNPISAISLPFPGSSEIGIFPPNNYNVNVNVRMTLIDFGRTGAGIDFAKARTKNTLETVEMTKRNLAFQTVQLFYGILFLERSIIVQETQLLALKKNLEETRKRVASGSATEFDVLTTQVQIATIESRKIDLVNTVSKQRIFLNRLLGTPEETALKLRGEFNYTVQTTDADSLSFEALRERVELRMSRNGVEIAKQQRHLLGKGNLPTLTAFAAYGIKNGLLPNLDALRGNFVGTFELQVPLFDGLRTSNQVQEAEAMVRAAENRVMDLELQVKAEVHQAISDLRTSFSQLQNSEVQISQARDAVKRARVSYSSGVITNLDLINAETALTQAELLQLQSLYGYVLNSYSLRQASGVRIWREPSAGN
jgi:outer membrane protein